MGDALGGVRQGMAGASRPQGIVSELDRAIAGGCWDCYHQSLLGLLLQMEKGILQQHIGP